MAMMRITTVMSVVSSNTHNTRASFHQFPHSRSFESTMKANIAKATIFLSSSFSEIHEFHTQMIFQFFPKWLRWPRGESLYLDNNYVILAFELSCVLYKKCNVFYDNCTPSISLAIGKFGILPSMVVLEIHRGGDKTSPSHPCANLCCCTWMSSTTPL